MLMGICKYCCSEQARPCFVVPINCGYEAFMAEDPTLRQTLTNYDVSYEAKRLVFPPEQVRQTDPAEWERLGYPGSVTAGRSLLDYVLLRDATPADEKQEAALIDGKAAVLRPIDSAHRPMACTMLACSVCHTVLPFTRYDSSHPGRYNMTEEGFRVALIANTSAGKTNLAAAMYHEFKNGTAGVDLHITEPLFARYHRDTAHDLEVLGKVPPSTQHSTPPLSLEYEMNGRHISMEIVDTRGEITKPPIDLEPCKLADLIIFLVDIRAHDSKEEPGAAADYITDIDRLSSYIYELSQHVHDKRIILAFSKCDLYENAADMFMFSDAEIAHMPAENRHANLRNLRNYRFSNDMEGFMDAVCAEINGNCPPDQQISENARATVSRIISDLVGHCNNISGYHTDIMCVAPLGTGTVRDADGTDHLDTSQLRPRYITELIELIKLYGGSKQ